MRHRCLGNAKKEAARADRAPVVSPRWDSAAASDDKRPARQPLPDGGLAQIHGLGIDLDGVVIALAHLLQDVAHLVHPTALMRGVRIDGLDDGNVRRIIARGRDIYAFSATLVCEVVERLLEGKFSCAGAQPPGAVLNAGEVLSALTPDHLAFEITAA